MDITFMGELLSIAVIGYWVILTTTRALYSYELEERIEVLEKRINKERELELG